MKTIPLLSPFAASDNRPALHGFRTSEHLPVMTNSPHAKLPSSKAEEADPPDLLAPRHGVRNRPCVD